MLAATRNEVLKRMISGCDMSCCEVMVGWREGGKERGSVGGIQYCECGEAVGARADAGERESESWCASMP
jgi:hypothetical protein